MLIAAQIIGTLLGMSLGFGLLALFLWARGRIEARRWAEASMKSWISSMSCIVQDANSLNREFSKIYTEVYG